MNTTRNQRERVSKLLLLYASEIEEVEELPFGSVGVILGLKHTRTGDTLVSLGGASKSFVLRDITPPPAVISSSVIPHSHSDIQPVQQALESLSRTDPSVRVDVEEGQILVHALGSLHLEIIEGRLRDEWDARFEFGKRRVAYREGLGPRDLGRSSKSWHTEVGGKQVEVRVIFSIRALRLNEEGDPAWDGNIVVDQNGETLAPDSMVPTQQSFVARGITYALSNSPNTSLRISHVHIQLQESHCNWI